MNKENTLEWEYYNISYLDYAIANMGEMQIKWILQDMGYPLFGVFNPEPDCDKYHYSRHDDIKNGCYVFGYRLI